MAKRRNWSAIMNRLNDSASGALTIEMGSPGSAQVTRCRLLEEWSNVDVSTIGSKLYIRLH
jgi:hypothetical protein